MSHPKHSFLGLIGLYISMFTLFLGGFVLLEPNKGVENAATDAAEG